jgi:hypothetical protein
LPIKLRINVYHLVSLYIFPAPLKFFPILEVDIFFSPDFCFITLPKIFSYFCALQNLDMHIHKAWLSTNLLCQIFIIFDEWSLAVGYMNIYLSPLFLSPVAGMIMLFPLTYFISFALTCSCLFLKPCISNSNLWQWVQT